MSRLELKKKLLQMMTIMKMNRKKEVDKSWENLRTNAWKEAIDKQIETKVVEEGPEQFKSVSSSFSVPSNDPWLVSVIRTLETSVMESVSLLGSTVTGLMKNSLTSKPPSPPPVPKLLTTMDKQGVMLETSMLVEMIQTNSASLVKDLVNINMKLASYPWLRNREDIREKLLRRLRVVEMKEEERILVRECKTRLGERETLTSPGVRVLSLDGGGMRGVVTLLMLEELEKMTGSKTHQMFDLIVGTSTGAVIASMMGISCMGAREGLELYRDMGRTIFKRSVVEGVGGLIQHQSYYDNMVLEEVLKAYTGDTMLFNTSWNKEIPAVSFVSSLVTNKVQPHLFSNYTHQPSSKPPFPQTTTLPIWQAIMASCAAPGYFSHVVISGSTHVDGAMVANNPTQLALLESKLLWPEERLQCLLSLGSGRSVLPGVEKNMTVSTKDMFSRSLDVLADTETVHQVLGLLLTGENYFRLNPPLEEKVEIDEIRVEQIEELTRYTRMYIRRNRRLFSDLAVILTEQPSRVDKMVRVVRENWRKLGI